MSRLEQCHWGGGTSVLLESFPGRMVELVDRYGVGNLIWCRSFPNECMCLADRSVLRVSFACASFGWIVSNVSTVLSEEHVGCGTILMPEDSASGGKAENESQGSTRMR
jgi:hypothetical protein